MSDKSYEEIFSEFEEVTNHYNRKDQYFDILYDSISSTIITKSPTAENFTVNTKKSGIVARSYLDSWKEVAIEANGNLDVIKEKIPKVSNKGNLIDEFDGWSLNKELKPKIDSTNVPIDEKIGKVREIYNLKDRFLMVATDRTSCFDVVLPTEIPHT